jgi:hypothetical protein
MSSFGSRKGNAMTSGIPQQNGHSHDDDPGQVLVGIGIATATKPRMVLVVEESGHTLMNSTLDRDTTARVLGEMAEHVQRNGFHRCVHYHL